MIKKMNFVRPALFAALLCGVSAVSALAQDPAAPNPGNPVPLTTPPASVPPIAPPRSPGGPSRPNLLFDALDTNHDGVISAEEIANASASLKTLLKNGSDHLTRDDLRPSGPPPHGASANPAMTGADQPGPKIGAIRPHGPPPQPEENTAAEPERPRMHRPSAPDGDLARENFDRPERRHEEGFQRWQFARREADEMDEARPYPRHERMSQHRQTPWTEREDERDDVRPPHPEPMRDDRESHSHHGPPPMPLFDALDTNHDGTISAEEIANASVALKGLLKNGSDHLTRDDLRPAGLPPGGQ